MTLNERIRSWIRKLSIELLAIWFAFLDRRVRWHAKLFLVLPIAYVASPLDLISDLIPFWGQLDDLVILRVSYLLIRKTLDAAVLADGRDRAARYLEAGTANRLLYWSALVSVWSTALFVGVRFLVRRLLRYI